MRRYVNLAKLAAIITVLAITAGCAHHGGSIDQPDANGFIPNAYARHTMATGSNGTDLKTIASIVVVCPNCTGGVNSNYSMWAGGGGGASDGPTSGGGAYARRSDALPANSKLGCTTARQTALMAMAGVFTNEFNKTRYNSDGSIQSETEASGYVLLNVNTQEMAYTNPYESTNSNGSFTLPPTPNLAATNWEVVGYYHTHPNNFPNTLNYNGIDSVQYNADEPSGIYTNTLFSYQDEVTAVGSSPPGSSMLAYVMSYTASMQGGSGSIKWGEFNPGSDGNSAIGKTDSNHYQSGDLGNNSSLGSASSYKGPGC